MLPGAPARPTTPYRDEPFSRPARRTPPSKPRGARASERGSSGAAVLDDFKPITGAVVFDERRQPVHHEQRLADHGRRRTPPLGSYGSPAAASGSVVKPSTLGMTRRRER